MPQYHSDRAVANRLATKTGRKRLNILLASLFMVALCATIRYYWGAEHASAEVADNVPARADGREHAHDERGHGTPSSPAPRPSSPAPRPSSPSANAPDSSVPAVVATVNTQRITREDLARQCRRNYGQEVLESIVNKHLIVKECQRQGVNVTRAEVDAEIERMAKRFSIPVDQWLKMLKQERNITAAQYAGDIIWPTLALRKLAANDPPSLARAKELRSSMARRSAPA